MLTLSWGEVGWSSLTSTTRSASLFSPSELWWDAGRPPEELGSFTLRPAEEEILWSSAMQRRGGGGGCGRGECGWKGREGVGRTGKLHAQTRCRGKISAFWNIYKVNNRNFFIIVKKINNCRYNEQLNRRSSLLKVKLIILLHSVIIINSIIVDIMTN